MMGRQERELKELKALRDTARAVFQADVDIVRGEYAPKAIATRASQRAADKAMDLADTALDAAERHRGALIGGVAAVVGGAVLWLVREPVGAVLETLHEKFTRSDATDAAEEDNSE